MASAPPLSVLLTVYNGERYVLEAIQSILAQTHRKFELLIINDGSTDGSHALLAAQKDERIRVINHESNQGLIATLNHGLALARGRWLALMDYDDLAQPNRLERQLLFLQRHPHIVLCGTQIETFGRTTGPGWVRYFSSDEIKTALLFENPLCHPSVMLDRDALRTLNLDYPEVLCAEDFALWAEVTRHREIANLPECLLRYRTHAQQVSQRRQEQQVASMVRVILEQLQRLGLSPTPRQLMAHQLLGSAFNPFPGYASQMHKWAQRLITANRSVGLYPTTSFEAQIAARYTTGVKRVHDQLGTMAPLRRVKWRLVAARNFWSAPAQ